ncbi:MAG TPA: hypothetical protein VFG06_03990 [Thermodesulfovibrionales bacterium]|nr:hypothetical protein [Thermodesulfovibrionales bacterium]
MKISRVLSLTVVLTLLFAVGGAYAGEIKTAGSASVDVMSNYVWRGQKLSNSWVIQPSVAVRYGVFGANIWANYDSDAKVDEGDGHGEVSETDLTLSYTRTLDKWTFGTGYIYYAFNGGNDTQEFYLSASYDTLLKPSLAMYYDFDEGNGAFVLASIGHSLEVAKGMNLNLGAYASYNINNKVMGLDEDSDDFSNFYNAELSASLNIPVWKAITVTPKIAYSFPLSDDSEDAIKGISDDGDKDIFYGGLNITLSF